MAEEKKLTKKRKPSIKYDYHVKLYEDGKYHWMYDLHLLKNPSVLIDVYKMLGMTVFITTLIIFVIQACSNGFHLKDMKIVLQIAGIMVAIFGVLGILGYLLYAAISGWKYSVHFIMDEKGVEHKSAPRSKKIAKRIGFFTAMAGLMAKRPGVVGAGMMAAGNSSMSSDFLFVRKVIALRKMNTIQVNERLSKNRVYVSDEDFDFVFDYISSRCPNAKIK